MPTEIKLDTFNNCPGAAVVGKRLAKLFAEGRIELADAKREYYQNDNDTLVVKFVGAMGDELKAIADELEADEFDIIAEMTAVGTPPTRYARIWWD